MNFDRAAAKQAGYTDEEIDAYLRQEQSVNKSQVGFDREAAKAAGYSDEEINAYLNQSAGNGSLAPQALAVGKELVAGMPQAAQTAGQGLSKAAIAAKNFALNTPISQLARGAADVGLVLHGHAPYASIAKQVISPSSTTLGQIGTQAMNVARQAAPAIASGARALGGAVLRGAMAPESLFAMPYQMAAYEQEKIRANPNAPEYKMNPYAQAYRGEYATQGQAGAANARRAAINMPYGNVTPEEKAMLEKDRAERMRMMIQVEAARRVLGQTR